jgi:hypothetical protein
VQDILCGTIVYYKSSDRVIAVKLREMTSRMVIAVTVTIEQLGGVERASYQPSTYMSPIKKPFLFIAEM